MQESGFEKTFEKYEEALQALEDEKSFNSFKLLGFEVNKGSLFSFIIFFGSLGISLYELIGN